MAVLTPNGGNVKDDTVIDSSKVVGVEYDDFDPSAPPPFKVADIRAAIPSQCWVKDPWGSMSYVFRDLVVFSALPAFALFFQNNWPLLTFYWVAQGTMFRAIFVIGHDCGHGSFSDSFTLNSIVGHILHSAILVPYHGWQTIGYFMFLMVAKRYMRVKFKMDPTTRVENTKSSSLRSKLGRDTMSPRTQELTPTTSSIKTLKGGWI